uniref:THAP-type domain-containing protein n=1 Tax=Ixodes ricinus TaxID=34613 RepID=A0A147BQP7_IXORI
MSDPVKLVKRRRCAVSRCKPSDRDAKYISSHGVPEDKNLRASWLEAIGRSPSDKFFRVCSRHFAPDAFKPRTGARLQLKPGVIPTLFLPTATAAAPLGKDVPGHSDTPEIESILPDDGLGWGSSSDNSSTEAVTIKTEPPDYVEQGEEPSSLVPAFTKDYTDMTKVTFHFNAEPQVSEETRRPPSAALAVKIEPPDPTEIRTEAVSTGTNVRDDFAAQQSGTVLANARQGLCSKSYLNGSGLDGFGGNTAMTAVTIKTDKESSNTSETPGSPLPPAAGRVGTANWCSCGSMCRPMQTVEESVCCRELHNVARMCSDQGVTCVTKHPLFGLYCLNTDILDLEYLKLRRLCPLDAGDRGPQEYVY